MEPYEVRLYEFIESENAQCVFKQLNLFFTLYKTSFTVEVTSDYTYLKSYHTRELQADQWNMLKKQTLLYLPAINLIYLLFVIECARLRQSYLYYRICGYRHTNTSLRSQMHC